MNLMEWRERERISIGTVLVLHYTTLDGLSVGGGKDSSEKYD
jgi:hypothetical protein